MNTFEIGIVVKPQGIRGEVRVLPTTFDSSRFALLIGDSVTLQMPSGGGGKSEVLYKILSARQHKGLVIVKFEGIDDRNAAETLVNGVIVIPAEKSLPLEADEYYVRDLVGLAVELENGEKIGVISRIINTNANDVYVIEETESEEGGSFMIPAIKDVVQLVDMQGGRVVIRLMDGLRELKV